jgi:excisionase family DNA binding protein
MLLSEAIMAQEFLTTEELANLLKVSDQTVRLWIRSGKVQSTKFGRGHRIPASEVDRLMTQHKGPSTFTAVFEEQPDGWYVAWVEELPGANTQGATMDEARSNLREAIELVIESRREIAQRQTQGRPVIREALQFAA